MLRARATTFRRSISAVALVVAASLAGCLTTEQQTVLGELNADRTASGRRALPADLRQAQDKAQAWAEHLARQGALSHSTLSAGMSGVRWCGLAENVAYAGSIPAAQDTLMNSAGHRTNILNTRWDVVGVGHARAGGRHYVVQFFVDLC